MVGHNVKCPLGISILNILLIDDVHLCLRERENENVLLGVGKGEA